MTNKAIRALAGGGIVTAAAIILVIVSFTSKADTCYMCSKPLASHGATLYHLEFTGGKEVTVCCAHCGVGCQMRMRNMEGDELESVRTLDYLTEKSINGAAAYYLVGSEEIPCCVPTVICFEEQSSAERFQREQGGKVYSLEEILRLPMEKLMKAG